MGCLKLTSYATPEQLEARTEFLESKCDLFSQADFKYYADKTGLGIDWVMDHAKYSDPDGIYGTCLENAILDGDYDLAEFFI